jgi:hypothetical protein
MAARTAEAAATCQHALERQLHVLGREDIGVGDLRLEDRRLVFTLWKGRFKLQAALPAVSLPDQGHFARRMCLVVVAFNRAMRRAGEESPTLVVTWT